MNPKSFSSEIVSPMFESLESRTFLNAAPTFADPLHDIYWLGAGARTIPINAFDADGDPVSVSFTPALGASSALTFTDNSGDEFARLHFTESDGTAIGDIVIQLFTNNPYCQAASNRFIALATEAVKNGQSVKGKPFYTDVKVHRIIDNFMIQTGDATNGTGTGNSGLPNIPDAGHLDPNLIFDGAGILALANAGANTSNGQFFITDGASSWLDGPPKAYMIFGQMISGWDVMAKLSSEPIDQNQNTDPNGDKPLNPPILTSVQILTSAQMSQADSYTITPPANWSGSEQVTVTLADGHGGVTSKVITIESQSNLGTLPTIGTIPKQFITPGSGGTFSIPATDDLGAPMTYTVTTKQAGVTATVDDNGLVHVAVPANFNGIFNVTVTAVEAGDIADRPPTTATVAIYSLQGSQTWVNTVNSTGTAVSPSAAVLSGNNLFVCAGTDGLIVYNVADPNNVTILGSYVYKVSSTAQFTRDIQLVGNTAFIVATNANQAGAGGGLIALDVSNPASIRLLDSVSSQPLNAAKPINAVSLTIRDNVAFVAGYTDGLYVFNISDPSNITPIYPQPISRPYPTVQIHYAWDVATKDNAVYIADPAGQIVVLTIGNGSILSYGKDILTKGHPLALYTYGNFLYVADETNGLMIYDVTNAAKPKLISSFATDGSAFSVSVMNQTAIVTTGTGYEVVNVANPKKPVEVSTFAASGNGRAIFVGDQFTVPFSESGVGMIDATDVLHTIVVPDKVSVSFHDQDGHLVTVTPSMCEVRITTSGVGSGTMDKIEVIPTSDKATVKITVAGGRATAGDIVVDSNIVSFSAPMVDVTGDVDFKGTVSGVTLGNMGQDSTLNLEKAGKPVTLLLDQVTDLSLTSAAPLTSLTVSSWTDSDDAVDITAPSIAKLISKGNFQGDMNLSGLGATKSVLGAATITGSLDGAHWNVTGAMGNLAVTETALDSSIRTTGNMGTLSMATADGSDFLAGVSANVVRHADDASDFTNILASIAGVKITGVKEGLTTDPYMMDSNFSAGSIGAATVANPLTDNLGTSFGFWARANGGKEFKSIKVTDLQSRQTWSWTAAQGLHLGDLLAESL